MKRELFFVDGAVLGCRNKQRHWLATSALIAEALSNIFALLRALTSRQSC